MHDITDLPAWERLFKKIAWKQLGDMATTEEYAQQNEYARSLFVADYAVTHTTSWDGLNSAGLIFGKNFAAGGVDYTLRVPPRTSVSALSLKS